MTQPLIHILLIVGMGREWEEQKLENSWAEITTVQKAKKGKQGKAKPGKNKWSEKSSITACQQTSDASQPEQQQLWQTFPPNFDCWA